MWNISEVERDIATHMLSPAGLITSHNICNIKYAQILAGLPSSALLHIEVRLPRTLFCGLFIGGNSAVLA